MTDSRKCPVCGITPGADQPPWCDLTFDPAVLTLAQAVVDMPPSDETAEDWARRMGGILGVMDD